VFSRTPTDKQQAQKPGYFITRSMLKIFIFSSRLQNPYDRDSVAVIPKQGGIKPTKFSCLR